MSQASTRHTVNSPHQTWDWIFFPSCVWKYFCAVLSGKDSNYIPHSSVMAFFDNSPWLGDHLQLFNYVGIAGKGFCESL